MKVQRNQNSSGLVDKILVINVVIPSLTFNHFFCTFYSHDHRSIRELRLHDLHLICFAFLAKSVAEKFCCFNYRKVPLQNSSMQ